MARADDDDGVRQSPSPSAIRGGDHAGDLTDTLAALATRLDHLEQSTAAFDRRLRVLEAGRQGAAPAPAASVIATPKPRAAPSGVTAPLPEPSPPKVSPETIRAAAHALLDEQPVPRQPGTLSAPKPVPPTTIVMPISPPRTRKRPAIPLDDLERAVSGRGLAWVGGLALLLGALFFLSLAISRGWIGPEARVVIGLVAGLVVTGLGDRLMRGGDRVLGPVLVAVGIGIWNLGLVAGTRLYGLMPDWAALVGAAAGAVVATSIAIRANAQVIALYGVVTALAAPILFAVPSARLSMTYLVIVLLGSTAIAVARGWSWLPPAAFLLSEFQFLSWWLAGGAPRWMALLAILSLSLLHLIAATGVDLRTQTRGAWLSALALLLLNALAFYSVGADELYREELGLGLYLLGGAAAHAAAGWVVLQRKGGATPFVRLAFAVAVTLLTVAVAVVFDGAPVAMVWAAEAVGLLWLAYRFRSAEWFAAGSIVYALAVAHLFLVEYDAVAGPRPQPGAGVPFVNEAGLVLLALLAALAAAGSISRSAVDRRTFAVVGFGLLIAALPFELSGLALLAGWSLLTVLALGAERIFTIPPDAVSHHLAPARFAAAGLKLPAAAAAGLAVYRAVAYEMPVLAPAPIEAGAAYVGQPVAAAAIVILAALAAMVVTVSDEVRQIAGSVAILIAANLAAYMLDPALAVAAWAGLAVVATFLQQRERGSFRVYLLTCGLLLLAGVGVTLTDIAPPTRLLVTAGAAIDHPFLWSEATLALGALAIAFAVIARMMRETPAGGWLALGSGVLALYLLSVGIVDEFQGRVDGTTSVAELRRQSQVALSVVWAVLGGVAVAVGLVRGVAALRWCGLGLLALTTAKVFLYDLASLDAVYRVLSFLVLGVLLLLSSYAYRRLGAADDERVPPEGVASAGAPGEPG